PSLPLPDHATLLHRQRAFGYTTEDQKYILGPMATNGIWAIGSMGTDTALAVLSDQPQLLYNYFKQLFAQVTNPPLDCIREELRTQVGLVIESGDAREVHHFCLLLGYGASVINPYLAFESLDDMILQGLLPGVDHNTAVKNYVKAVYKGVVKVMAKMGISTV